MRKIFPQKVNRWLWILQRLNVQANQNLEKWRIWGERFPMEKIHHLIYSEIHVNKFKRFYVNKYQNCSKNVRISMGPSSTTRVELSTGPPLTGEGCSPLSPSTFHVIFFISDFSWFDDKLISFSSLIWKLKHHLATNMKENKTHCAEKDRNILTAFPLNIFFSSTLASVE